jgi:hypothetical protein
LVRFEVLFLEKFVAFGAHFNAHKGVYQNNENFGREFGVDADVGEGGTIELCNDFGDTDNWLLEIELLFPYAVHCHLKIKLSHLLTEYCVLEIFCSFNCISELMHDTVEDAVVQKLAFQNPLFFNTKLVLELGKPINARCFMLWVGYEAVNWWCNLGNMDWLSDCKLAHCYNLRISMSCRSI